MGVCRVLGAVLIVIGLYSVLWGKHKENIENKAEEIPEAIKGPHQANGNGSTVVSVIEDIEANEAEVEKSKNKLLSLAIAMPTQEVPPIMKTNPAQQKA